MDSKEIDVHFISAEGAPDIRLPYMNEVPLEKTKNVVFTHPFTSNFANVNKQIAELKDKRVAVVLTHDVKPIYHPDPNNEKFLVNGEVRLFYMPTYLKDGRLYVDLNNTDDIHRWLKSPMMASLYECFRMHYPLKN